MISSIAQDFWATIAENSFQFRGNFSRDFCPRFNYHRVQRPKSQARVLEPSCIDLLGNKTRLATMRVYDEGGDGDEGCEGDDGDCSGPNKNKTHLVMTIRYYYQY